MASLLIAQPAVLPHSALCCLDILSAVAGADSHSQNVVSGGARGLLKVDGPSLG